MVKIIKAPAPITTRTLYKSGHFRHLQVLRNWKSCDPKWWAFIPTGNKFYFKVEQKKKMIALLTKEEIEQISILHQVNIGKMEIAFALKIPYDFLEWWIKRDTTTDFVRLKTNRHKLTILERQERLEKALVTELEDRMANERIRTKMTYTEIIKVKQALKEDIADGKKGGPEKKRAGPQLITRIAPKNEKTTDPESQGTGKDLLGLRPN